MAFFKGLIPGTLLTFVVAMILGSNGSRGGWLDVHRMTVEGISFHWSWPLFLIATGLAWGIFWMME